jgi:transcriptional regulator with XRE-family HTH domain
MTEQTMTLAELRQKRGLSQADVARELGVSRNQVSRTEAMYPNVMFTKLRAYLDVIGVDIRFTADGIDVLSGEVTEDTARIYAESRRKDPTRAGKIQDRRKGQPVAS